MKEKIEYRYEFANGDVVELKAEVSEKWMEMLIDMDRREYNNNQTERRRHCSLNALDQDDNDIPMERDVFEDFYEEEIWKEMCKELTEREQRIGDLLFRKGYKQRELTKIFGVNETRISQIIYKIRKKLKKFA